MNSLIDIFFDTIITDDQIKTINLNNNSNYQLIEELNKYFTNSTLVNNITQETQKKIINSVDTIIMRVVNKEINATNSHIIKLIDLLYLQNLYIFFCI